MEGLAFHGVPDTVRATAYYIGEPSEVGIEQSDTVHVRKDFLPMEGGKYKVTLTVDFEDAASYGLLECQRLGALQPCACTQLARQPQSNQFWVNWTQENQKMYFEFYRRRAQPLAGAHRVLHPKDLRRRGGRRPRLCHLRRFGRERQHERSTLG